MPLLLHSSPLLCRLLLSKPPSCNGLRITASFLLRRHGLLLGYSLLRLPLCPLLRRPRLRLSSCPLLLSPLRCVHLLRRLGRRSLRLCSLRTRLYHLASGVLGCPLHCCPVRGHLLCRCLLRRRLLRRCSLLNRPALRCRLLRCRLLRCRLLGCPTLCYHLLCRCPLLLFVTNPRSCLLVARVLRGGTPLCLQRQLLLRLCRSSHGRSALRHERCPLRGSSVRCCRLRRHNSSARSGRRIRHV